jgi:hypothetical protein
MIAPRVVTPRHLRVAGLFAGIGGIELGLARAGHHAGLLCEIEPGARPCSPRGSRACLS